MTSKRELSEDVAIAEAQIAGLMEEIVRLREENERLKDMHDSAVAKVISNANEIDVLQSRLSELQDFHAKKMDEMHARLSAAEKENAELVDRHNRESHGVVSHEAMAYDDLQARLSAAEEVVEAAKEYAERKEHLDLIQILRRYKAGKEP